MVINRVCGLHTILFREWKNRGQRLSWGFPLGHTVAEQRGVVVQGGFGWWFQEVLESNPSVVKLGFFFLCSDRNWCKRHIHTVVLRDGW